ncbi:MAG: hypothetical protein ABIZ80_02220 [Bryobacteraceae bacterium]
MRSPIAITALFIAWRVRFFDGNNERGIAGSEETATVGSMTSVLA